ADESLLQDQGSRHPSHHPIDRDRRGARRDDQDRRARNHVHPAGLAPRKYAALTTLRICASRNSPFDESAAGAEVCSACHTRRHLTGAVLPPERSLNPAANREQRWCDDGGKMLGKLLALTAVIGLLVASSAAFVANHPAALTACAVGVL